MNDPLTENWTAPFAAPPLDRIKAEHFAPAYAQALAEHAGEIRAIAANAEAPSFANTIVALEQSGRALTRIEQVFHNLASSHTNDALQAIELEMAPKLAQHWNAITLNAELFARIDALYRRRGTLGLDAEELRVLERYHLDFVRAGAQLGAEDKTRYAALTERLASLGTEFGQNVLADEQETVLPLSEADVAGLPEFARAAAAETAKERGLDAPYAATTSRSSAEPILTFADNRDVREKLYKAWAGRGDMGGAHDNKALIAEIVKAARRGSPSPRLQEFCRIPPGRHHGQDARDSAGAAGKSLGAGQGAGDGGTRGAAGSDHRRGRKFRARRMGLALLRGEAAERRATISMKARSCPISSSTG